MPTRRHVLGTAAVFWRYHANVQRAVREGDMKWLKINENTFLLNLVEDPLERAHLKQKQPELFARLAADYRAWEATMLPEDPAPGTYCFNSTQLADHYTPQVRRTPPGDPGP